MKLIPGYIISMTKRLADCLLKRLSVSGFIVVILSLVSVSTSNAQGDCEFFGRTIKDNHPLAGASVNVTIDGHDYKSLTTGSNGRFKLTLDLGHQYKISFSAQGCVDMFMTLDFRVPKEKMGIYPQYKTDIPFFEPGSKAVRVNKYKDQPFIKVIFDGNGGFKDDPEYKFTEDIVIDQAEELRKQAAIAAAAAEQKAKEEADKKAKEDALAEEARKAKAAAEQKALEDAVARAKDDESRKKAEEALKAKQQETMESEAMRLEKEKQEKSALEKKNKGIRTQYENDLLKMVAESEKKANLQKYNNMKNEAESRSVIQSMRKAAELKANAELLRNQEKEKAAKTLVNKQTKMSQLKKLIEAAALTERTIRVSTEPAKDPHSYTHVSEPNIVVAITEGVLSDIRITSITDGALQLNYKEEKYVWGTTYYYKDNKEIDELTYHSDLKKYVHTK
ncbi:MAG: hypothetical protein ACHQRM_09045 [Bacteroidia bacterium]